MEQITQQIKKDYLENKFKKLMLYHEMSFNRLTRYSKQEDLDIS